MKYSTKHIATILQEMDTPYQDFLARALVALIVGRKAVINQISKLMPGKANPEANRQEMRRFLGQPSMTPERWAKIIAGFLPKLLQLRSPISREILPENGGQVPSIDRNN